MKPHYDKIRRVKTASGATAIQVGFYQGKRFVLTKHIGSSKDNHKVIELSSIAQEYIHSHSPQLEFNFNPHSEEILFKRGIKVKASYLQEAYEYLERVYNKIGFGKIKNDLLKHFAMIRVLEPSSKTKSIILLEKYFNIVYKRTTVFREFLKLVELKEEIIKVAIKYAKDNLNFDFSLIFYDVTTLYFETNEADELRRPGFSKDNKINQPQILIGLVVERVGFPIYFDIFKGNTFEGKTIIPVILTIKEKYQINKFTVIADAGMLSEDNLLELKRQGINYVVGARAGLLSFEKINAIVSKLGRIDRKIVKVGDVIYEYSSSRAKKDKADNDKQIEKAKYLLNHPSKVTKRSRFLSSTDKKRFKLNTALIKKHRLLEGIKGYKTNIKHLRYRLLVARYKDLWKIEQSFRMAKSDLEARPIYHRKEYSIKYHILIVFVSLCMAKLIEIEKNQSIKKVIDDLKDKWTITLFDEISGNSLKVFLDKKPH